MQNYKTVRRRFTFQNESNEQGVSILRGKTIENIKLVYFDLCCSERLVGIALYKKGGRNINDFYERMDRSHHPEVKVGKYNEYNLLYVFLRVIPAVITLGWKIYF